MSGDGAIEYDNGHAAKLGTLNNGSFKGTNERLEKMGLDAFKQE